MSGLFLTNSGNKEPTSDFKSATITNCKIYFLSSHIQIFGLFILHYLAEFCHFKENLNYRDTSSEQNKQLISSVPLICDNISHRQKLEILNLMVVPSPLFCSFSQASQDKLQKFYGKLPNFGNIKGIVVYYFF